MRIADYLAEKLYSVGVEDVFLVTGGGMMFLTDGLACHKQINAVPCLHEQGAAMAAISYAQYRNNYGACFVTTGCGGTNAVTGVLHAYQDHIPVVYVSGQCNRNEMMSSVPAKVRSIGQQEADIVSIVESITKYAVTIMEPEDAVYHIEKALYLAKSGSWGPVWLDIPMDVQEAVIDLSTVRHFNSEELSESSHRASKEDVDFLVKSLEESERPLVILGAGVRASEAEQEFTLFVENNKIPYVGTRRGWDICPKSNDLHIGLADIRGNRSANMALQNADFVLVLGSRLSLFTTGYNYELFARGAKRVIVVDIDEEEHKKNTVKIDRVIDSDIKYILNELPALKMKDHSAWVEKCRHWKEVFPVFTEEQKNDENGISKFAFIGVLNKYLEPKDIVVTDAGATTEIPMQGLLFKHSSQRYIGSATQCEMGFALPGIVGASVAAQRQKAICIVGDGSLQMNIQELQTCITQKLPVKLFVWNNGGYGTIKGHQKTIFKGRYLGVDAETGTAFPNLQKIAEAYGYEYYQVSKLADLDNLLKDTLSSMRPIIYDIICWKEEVNPMVKGRYRKTDGTALALPLEDMFPPVDRELFESEMIIEPIRWWE